MHSLLPSPVQELQTVQYKWEEARFHAACSYAVKLLVAGYSGWCVNIYVRLKEDWTM